MLRDRWRIGTRPWMPCRSSLFSSNFMSNCPNQSCKTVFKSYNSTFCEAIFTSRHPYGDAWDHDTTSISNWSVLLRISSHLLIEHFACRYPLCSREWHWESCEADAAGHSVYIGQHHASEFKPVQKLPNYTNQSRRFSRPRKYHTRTHSTITRPRTFFIPVAEPTHRIWQYYTTESGRGVAYSQQGSSLRSPFGRWSHEADCPKWPIEYVGRGCRQDQVGDGYVRPNCGSARIPFWCPWLS